LFAPEVVGDELLPPEPVSPSPALRAPQTHLEPHGSGAASGVPPDVEGGILPSGESVRPNRGVLVVVFLLVALGGVGAGAYYYWKHRKEPSPAALAPVLVNTNDFVATANEPAPAPPPTPVVPKSLADLKVGAITLEKAKSGSLVYAAGVLKNDSDYARYGVKIELDLSDAQGRGASKATDYTQVIEPRKEWRFRALILDSKAVSAKLAKVTEDD